MFVLSDIDVFWIKSINNVINCMIMKNKRLGVLNILFFCFYFSLFLLVFIDMLVLGIYGTAYLTKCASKAVTSDITATP